MNKRISQDDIIYFVVTDRFFGSHKTTVSPSDKKIHGGTLDGILDKLDYLIELGITAIWVTPVYKNIDHAGDSEPYHYYWPENFEKVDDRLLDQTRLHGPGTMATFAHFVDQCEAKGIKVILDIVVNHAGYGAEAHFEPGWFNVGGSGDIKGQLAGLPDFNHDNPEVLDYFINNIEDWIRKGKVTNFRMDTVKHVEPRFWHFFKSQIRGQYPATYLIGEVLFEGREDIKELVKYQNYHDFDSTFDFPLCTALRSTLIYDESLKNWLARPRISSNEQPGILDSDNPFTNGYRNPDRLVTLLDNHDLQQRIMSHARSKHPGDAEGLNWAIRVTKLCLGALFTIRGIPQIYYGTEVALEGWKTDQGDQDMRRDFPWEWIGNDNHPKPEFQAAAEIFNWTKDLIRLRKGNAALKYGTTITLWSDDLLYAFLRISTDDVAFVIINNGYRQTDRPTQIFLNPAILPERVIASIAMAGLNHWQTDVRLPVHEGMIQTMVEAKTIDIYCR